MDMDIDALQWVSLAVLLCLSVTTLVISLQNSRLSKDVHQTKGKVDLLANTYAEIFRGMHERIGDALSDNNTKV